MNNNTYFCTSRKYGDKEKQSAIMNVHINEEWKEHLCKEFDRFYFQELVSFVKHAYASEECYPPGRYIFRAFDETPFSRVKVVILGQDPYHTPGAAEGLAFSVPQDKPIPPSLRNILSEIEKDTGSPSIIVGGHLGPWAQQGVLLLNSTLTVAKGRAASHAGHGWETFTDAAIKSLATERSGLVFMLWGSYAQRKIGLIPEGRHLILCAPHPSPLSASRGFFGCKHFTQANQYLVAQGKEAICW